MTDQEQQSVRNAEKIEENESKSSEKCSTISEDIRCSTERNDRDKLMEKYDNYQVSSTNACNIRFLADHRQKQALFGRPEGIHQMITSIMSCFFLRGKLQLTNIDQNIQCEYVCKY